jgi:hypothetical protein
MGLISYSWHTREWRAESVATLLSGITSMGCCVARIRNQDQPGTCGMLLPAGVRSSQAASERLHHAERRLARPIP